MFFLCLKNIFTNSLFCYLVKAMVNLAGYYAERLKDAMKGLGTKDTQLIWLLVSRSEVSHGIDDVFLPFLNVTWRFLQWTNQVICFLIVCLISPVYALPFSSPLFALCFSCFIYSMLISLVYSLLVFLFNPNFIFPFYSLILPCLILAHLPCLFIVSLVNLSLFLPPLFRWISQQSRGNTADSLSTPWDKTWRVKQAETTRKRC